MDLVTQVDQEVEALVFGELRQHYPDHKFVGEEDSASAGHERTVLSNHPTWVVDPIDGTTNFVHKCAAFLTRVALGRALA